MNRKANCHKENGGLKCCPFRVLRAEHPPVLRGHGTTVTEQFYECLGENCVAYHNGVCLRMIDKEDMGGCG